MSATLSMQPSSPLVRQGVAPSTNNKSRAAWLTIAVLVPLLPKVGVPWAISLVLAVAVSSWAPGLVIAAWLGLNRLPTRDALIFALSATVAVSMAMVLATFGWTQVMLAWYLVMVLPLAISLFLDVATSVRQRGVARGRHAANPQVEADRGTRTRRTGRETGWWWLAASTSLWAAGLYLTDATSLGPMGLLPVMSPLWWAGGAVLVVWITHRALTATNARDLPFRAGILCLVLLLHLPGIVFDSAPRLPWVFKHFGVVDYITSHHMVDPRIDVYHNWPGFFAYASWLNRLTGADSMFYANYVPVVVNLAAAFLASALYREFAISAGARHLGIVFLIMSNWFSQDYFSPQALAYLLYIALLLFCVVAYGHRPVRRWVRLPRWLAPQPIATGPGNVIIRGNAPRWGMFGAIYLGLLMLTATHQLTPVFMVATLALGATVGVWRTWPATFVAGFILVGYLASRLPYLAEKYNISINLNPLDNASGTTETLVQVSSSGAVLAGRAALVITAVLALSAMAGMIIGLRKGLPVINQMVVGAAPALAFLAQSYGGEALYRVAMFSEIGLAPLAAGALMALRGWRKNPIGAWAPIPVTVLLLVMYVPAQYGNEMSLRVTRAEADNSRWMYEYLPSGAIIYPALNPTPVRSAGNYPEHIPGTGQYDPELLTATPALAHGALPTGRDGSLLAIKRYMISLTPNGACSYVVFTPSMIRYVDTYGPHTAAQLEALQKLMTASKDYTVVKQENGILVLRLHDQGRGGSPRLPGVVVAPQKCS